MSLKDVIYTSMGLIAMGIGYIQQEYMVVHEQRYIGEFLDKQTGLTKNTMDEARASAANRNSFNGLTSILFVAGGVCFAANGTMGGSRKQEDLSRKTEKQ